MKKGLIVGGSICLILVLTIGIAEAATSDSKLKGKILLQVESRGEAWYVDPSTGERNSLGKPSEAFNVMRNAGVGITNANLQKIQLADKNLNGNTDTDNDGLSDVIETALSTKKDSSDSDSDGTDDKTEVLNGYDPNSSDTGSLLDASFAKKQAGKILLQVESKGEAWYVNPDDNKRYFLGRPSDAFNIMRSLGLGITNTNLNKIKIRGKSASSDIATNTDKKIDKGEKGDDKNRGTSTPPMSEEMTAACSGKSAGDACSITNDRGTMTGTCKTADSKLFCQFSRSEDNASGTPPMNDRVGNKEKGNGLMGTITAVGDSTLTISIQDRGSSSTVSYVVSLNSSTVYSKDRATSTISEIVIGAKAMVFGTIDTSAKTVVATKVDIITKEPADMGSRPQD